MKIEKKTRNKVKITGNFYSPLDNHAHTLCFSLFLLFLDENAHVNSVCLNITYYYFLTMHVKRESLYP